METSAIQPRSGKRLTRIASVAVFFLAGAVIALFVMSASFAGLFYQHFRDRIYPNVKVMNVDVSAMTRDEAKNIIQQRFASENHQWQLIWQDKIWTFGPTQLQVSLDVDQMLNEAYSLGRRPNPYQSFGEIIQTYFYGFNVPAKLVWNNFSKEKIVAQMRESTDYPPIEAQFKFQPGAGPDSKGRVVVFVQSKAGQQLDTSSLESEILQKAGLELVAGSSIPITINVPVTPVNPTITSDVINNLGIVQKLGEGSSFFYDSIPERVYNISLGTDKINGSLVGPGETFSFDQAIGTVSAVFGFHKAYAIIKGKTVLDDGGGVCQVSTTLYRAALNAGLPIIEREAHTYRVPFYEEGGYLPGIDATVYPPSPDFKFRNDTNSSILIQATFDKAKSKLTFELFGTSDGRVSTVSKPIILSTSPPPPPIYEDDPTLPNGEIKQVDTAHAGAKVYFTRKVIRGDQILIDERVDTNYVPWPARFLKGTKT